MNQPSKLKRAIIAVLSVLTVCLVGLFAYLAGSSSSAPKPSAVRPAEPAEAASAAAPADVPEDVPEVSIPELAQSVLYLEVYDGDGYLLGTASGFLIDEKTLVTNYHVIDGACYLSAFTPDYEVSVDFPTLLAYDEEIDLAILRSSHAPDAEIFPLADSDAVRQGDKVYAVGYPLGLANTLTEGIVGAVYDMDTYKLLQISAPISQGNSGGAVLNEAGEAVGVACMYLIDGQNMNYAVASNDVRRLYEQRGEELPLEEFYYGAAADAVEPEPAPAPQQAQPKPENPPQAQPAPRVSVPQTPPEQEPEPPRETPEAEEPAREEPVFSESDVIARLQGKWHGSERDREATYTFTERTYYIQEYRMIGGVRYEDGQFVQLEPERFEYYVSGTFEPSPEKITFHWTEYGYRNLDNKYLNPSVLNGRTPDFTVDTSGGTRTDDYRFNADGSLLIGDLILYRQ